MLSLQVVASQVLLDNCQKSHFHDGYALQSRIKLEDRLILDMVVKLT